MRSNGHLNVSLSQNAQRLQTDGRACEISNLFCTLSPKWAIKIFRLEMANENIVRQIVCCNYNVVAGIVRFGARQESVKYPRLSHINTQFIGLFGRATGRKTLRQLQGV